MSGGTTTTSNLAPVFSNVEVLDVTGDGARVEVPDSSELNITGDITVAAWINPATLPQNGSTHLVFKGANSPFNVQYLLAYDGTGNKARFLVNNDTGFNGDFCQAVGATDITANTWHLLVGTFDASAGDVKIYLDGALDDSLLASDCNVIAGTIANAEDLGIGSNANDAITTFQFDGLMDDVRIYERVLNLAEIQILNSGKALPDPYADEVAFDGIDNTSCGGDCRNAAGDAVGPPDGDGAGLGDLGFLDLAFTNNTCLVNSTDLDVVEEGDNESYFVGFGATGSSTFSTSVGPFLGDEFGIDLSSTGVGVFNEIKIKDDGVPASPSPGTAVGADIDSVACLNNLDFGPDHISKAFFLSPSDGSGNEDEVDQITKANDVQQFKAFTITIANNTGVNGGLDGLIFFDSVPAEWDLDPNAEDLSRNGVDGCAGGGDGNCDGVEASGPCTFTLDIPTGAKAGHGGNKLRSKLEPEFIIIDPNGLANGQMCMLTVFVKTDKGHKKTFTPTSCPVTLNDGVEVYDDTLTPGVLTSEDVLLFTDDDSLIFDDNDPVSEGVCNLFVP